MKDSENAWQLKMITGGQNRDMGNAHFEAKKQM